ncbi:MAG: serine/threonine-protein kinase [Gordonia sp. (in: high G+C Gram-positive bacteria)]
MNLSKSDRVGETFGPYRLDALLGRGGMGEVYRAHDTAHDRDVALKLLPPQLATDPTFQERFRRECQKLARLGEPHIIPIHNYGEIDSTLFLDMRLVDGRDLRTIITERGALAPADAVALIEQIAAALAAAHSAGLVHRDIKPENVLVTSAEFAYLIDFGVAHAESETHLTKTGTAIGSIAYMSPEQFENTPITAASDVYSLSAVFFELLTGRQPYPGDSISTVTRAVLFDDIPAPSALNPAIGPELDAVVVWGLAKDPAKRCPSTMELARAARRALAGEAPPVMPGQTEVIAGAAPTITGTPPTTPAAPVTLSGPQAAYAPTAYRVQMPPGVAPGLVSGPAMPGPEVRVASGPVSGVNPAMPHYLPGQGVPSQPVPVGYPAGYPPPPPARSGIGGVNMAMIVLIGILLAALAGVGAWLAVDKFGGSDDTTTAATGPAAVTATEQATVTATTQATPTYVPGPPPSDNQQCAPGVGTGYPQWTGCEFAINVRDAYISGGPNGQARVVNGWAPQQRKWYVMSCDPYAGIIACRGGNQAVVYVY